MAIQTCYCGYPMQPGQTCEDCHATAPRDGSAIRFGGIPSVTPESLSMRPESAQPATAGAPPPRTPPPEAMPQRPMMLAPPAQTATPQVELAIQTAAPAPRPPVQMIAGDAVGVIKAAMGYTEAMAPRCENCQNAGAGEDDGGGDAAYTCNLNPAFKFGVQPNGRCKHFQERET